MLLDERAALPRRLRFSPLTSVSKDFQDQLDLERCGVALCFEALRLAYANAGRHGVLAAPTFEAAGRAAGRTGGSAR